MRGFHARPEEWSRFERSLIGKRIILLHADPDHYLFNQSIVGVVNPSISGYIAFDFSTDGIDGGTMSYTGSTRTSTPYGALHV